MAFCLPSRSYLQPKPEQVAATRWDDVSSQPTADYTSRSTKNTNYFRSLNLIAQCLVEHPQPRFQVVPLGPSSRITPLAARSLRMRSASAKFLALRAASLAAMAASISLAPRPSACGGCHLNHASGSC